MLPVHLQQVDRPNPPTFCPVGRTPAPFSKPVPPYSERSHHTFISAALRSRTSMVGRTDYRAYLFGMAKLGTEKFDGREGVTLSYHLL